MKPIKMLSLFSGIGAFEKALDNIGAEYDLEGYCEIDRYAAKGYALIHNTEEQMNLKDVTKIDEEKLPKDIDLLTYGFPCQDISIVGNQRGLTDEHGNKTRSGLVWDATRIIKEAQPKITIAENVKNLVGKNFTNEFKAILTELEEAGYNNYWKVLNAKEHGIAQNRERVFIVSIRKDIDLGLFEWPDKEELTTRLLDYLEDEVDEKYFISDKMMAYFTDMTNRNGFVRGARFRPHTLDSKYAFTITTNAGQRPTDNFIIMPGELRYDEGIRLFKDDVIGTIRTTDAGGDKVIITSPPLRIRKLTPKECFRLMGFDDEDHDKLERAGISNSQRYKMAGNSIVVRVLEKILKNLIESTLEKGETK